MKKKLLTLILLLLPLTAAKTFAVVIDGINYNVNTVAKTAEVARSSYSGKIVIPPTVEYYGVKYDVTSIGSNAFYYCSGLTSVTIPNSVTSISEGAFYKCNNVSELFWDSDVSPSCVTQYSFHIIAKVVFGEKIKTIGVGAFLGCSKLTSVTIPNSVTSISSDAFYGCSGLTSVTIPNSVTSIGSNAFRGCSSLTSVTIPNSVTSIGSSAFYGCSKLTFVTIPNSVTSISEGAFDKCNNVSELYWDSDVSPSCITQYSSQIIAKVVFGEKIKTIGVGAFLGCSSLTSVTIPNSVTSISSDAFYGCSGLTSVTIPNSVTSIGSNAFRGCSSLTSVTIPNSVTSIGSSAFSDCSSLTSVYISDLEAWCKIAFSDNDSNPLSYAHRLFLNGEEIKDLVIPNSVTSIRGNAFYGCSGLTSVTIPNSVTSIGSNAFRGCSSLTSVTIPNSVTSIGSSAFSDCSSLTSVYISDLEAWCKIAFSDNDSNPLSYAHRLFLNGEEIKDLVIPNSVTSISEGAFFGCSGLTSVTIPSSVISIGSNAFCGCSKLTSVTIPNSVTSIGSNAFYGCSKLTFVTIPNSVTSISEGAFDKCNNVSELYWDSDVSPYCITQYSSQIIAKVVFGEKIKTIGVGAFRGCSSLTSVTIPNSVTSISSDAFYSCSSLTSVYISDLEAWCKIAFSNNYSNPLSYAHRLFLNGEEIKDLVIPNSVTSIGGNAFYGCSKLTSVTIPNSVTSIGSNAFYGCSRLTSVTIPNSVTSISEGAFDKCNNVSELYWDSDVSPSCITQYSFHIIAKVVFGEKVKTIGGQAFYNCRGLTFVTIGSSVTNIENSAFYNCQPHKVIWLMNTPPYGYQNVNGKVNYVSNDQFSGLQNVFVYPFLSSKFEVDGITYVPVSPSERTCDAIDCVFDGSTKKSIVPETVSFKGVSMTVQKIQPYFYYGNTTIQSLTIPKSVTAINDYVFGGCTGLKEVVFEDREGELTLGSNGQSPMFADCPLDTVYIGGNISYNSSPDAGYSPFYRNTTLRTVVFTDKETEISDNEFYGCTNLQNFSIGDGVTTFGNWAFSGCSSLKSLSFGSKLKSIGQEAFSDCGAVTRIVSKAPTPPVCGTQALDDINKWSCTLTVPKGSLADYQTADQWKEFFFVEEGDFSSSFNLTYMVDGQEYKTYRVAFGDKITPENEPVKEGYTFSGWSEIPEIMPGEDVVVTGSFTVNSYRLIYKIDGEEYKSYTVEYGKEIVPEKEPAKEGYTFSGWSEIPETMPAYDVTVTGSFASNLELTIQDAASGKTTIVVKDGEQVTLSFTPASGWKLNSVTYNDVDVTLQLNEENRFTTPAIIENSTIIVTYEEIDNASAPARVSSVRIQGIKSGVRISGAEQGDVVNIYDADGKLFYSAEMTSSQMEIPLDKDNVYIVKVGGKIVKLRI